MSLVRPQDQELLAIRTFLANFPVLQQPIVRDFNRHPALPSPTQRHGSILLPLWTRDHRLLDWSQDIDAYKTFLASLDPVLTTLGEQLRDGSIIDKSFHRAGLQAYRSHIADPNRTLPTIFPQGETKVYNCFQYMRLNGNLALDTHQFDAGQGTRRVVLVGFGDGEPRIHRALPAAYGSPERATWSSHAVFINFPPGATIRTDAYFGEWYTLELYLPPVSELGEGTEAV